MDLAGIAVYLDAKKGDKDGKVWRFVKMLDNERSELITAWVDEELYETASQLKKGSLVSVSFNIVPGKAFSKLVGIEAVK